MATPVIMPRQGQTVESCIITQWHKKKGDKVSPGDLLFSYETDKANFEEEAKVEGTLLDVFFEEGDDVPVLTAVAVIGEEGESIDEFRPGGGPADSGVEKTSEEKTVESEASALGEPEMPSAGDAVFQTAEGRLKISPRARHLAERVNVDPRYAVPTGPEGRIIERDVLHLAATGPKVTPAAMDTLGDVPTPEALIGTGLGGSVTTRDIVKATEGQQKGARSEADVVCMEYQDVKLSNIRKVIAKAMFHSVSSTAQLTLTTSFDATDILAFRRKLKDNRDALGLENITLNDIIIYAVSRTLLNHKELNAHFLEDRMRFFTDVHMGVAVDTQRGLMVPTIFNANRKSLNEISREVKQLAAACQKGSISPDELTGGTFTITNLGTLGIESFTPVLNPPQTGILGVNTIVQRVKEIDGEYVYYPAMGLSLTFDHRALDGAPAARFLKELTANLENFSLLLAK